MPVIEAKESTQVAHAAIEARRAAAARQARLAARAELTARNADTTSPLKGMPEATLPDPPAREETAPAAEVKARPITLQTTVEHRGRTFVIQAEGITLDQFCDLLDRRGYAPPAEKPQIAPIAAPDDLPDGWKLCRKHGAPMRPRNKQGENWHSHNVGTAENPLWCKGYKGSDSPGYDH